MTFTVADSAGVKSTKSSTVTVLMKLAPINAAPVLVVQDSSMKQGEALDPMTLVLSATDAEDGDLAAAVTLSDDGGLDANTPGRYTLTFSLTDSAGVTVQKTATVSVLMPLTPISVPPVLVVDDAVITAGDTFDLASMIVSANDQAGVDLTSSVTIVDDGGFDPARPGQYVVTFQLADSADTVVTKTATVTINEKPVEQSRTQGSPSDDRTSQPARGKELNLPKTGGGGLGSVAEIPAAVLPTRVRPRAKRRA